MDGIPDLYGVFLVEFGLSLSYFDSIEDVMDHNPPSFSDKLRGFTVSLELQWKHRASFDSSLQHSSY